MFEFLYSWKFWVVIAVVIILLVWLASKFQWKTEDKKKRKTRSSRDYLVSYEELNQVTEESLDCSVSTIDMNRSYARTLPKEWLPEIPEEILNPQRPESERKMTANETKGERLCKEAAEKIYGVTFHRSVWPTWLRNPETNRVMELDLYNDELKIAIEYNGRQHYQYVPHFHKKGVKDFEAQVRRDHYKLDICDTNGVYVIVVPFNLPDDKIETWIRYYDPNAYALRQAREQQLR